jgi:general secretion pathway protein G
MSRAAEPRRTTIGFTLVEVLIVMVILGILAGIVVFAVGNLTSNARSTGCSAEKTALSTALEEYKSQSGSYPAAMSDLTAGPGALLRSAPAGYDFDASGTIVPVPDNAGGCT